MSGKNHSHRFGTRALALLLTTVMVGGLAALIPTYASAATSLSGIESIKTQGSFLILEIVPRSGTGSIGYYVDGQEPVSAWRQEAAAKTSRDDRKTYVKGLLDSLSAAKLMGDVGTSEDLYPLTKLGDYNEYYPWDAPMDSEQLTLQRMESAQVSGSFTADSNGDYIQVNTYRYDESGSYVENPLYFVYGQRFGTSSDYYYYHVTFTREKLTSDNVEDFVGVPLYTPVSDSGFTYYEYAGTLSNENDDFRIDDDINADTGIGYWIASGAFDTHPKVNSWEHSLEEITVTAENKAGLAGKTLYTAAVDGESIVYTAFVVKEDLSNIAEGATYYQERTNAYSYFVNPDPQKPFRPAASGETGSFAEVTGYRYVGEERPEGVTEFYSFTPSEGGELQTVQYNTVFTTGGFRNNNWFKRYVLDMDDAQLSALRINVISLTPSELTETLVQNAGLVVVSSGFDPLKNQHHIPYTEDVNDTFLTALQQKPRVVDTGIRGSVTNLLSLKDGDLAPAVTSHDVYNFAVGTGNDYRPALATNLFHKPFKSETGYEVVAAEIKYENELRGAANKELLSTDISMATCIRYIINTHRAVNKKTALHVLDIEPVSRYDQTDDNGPLKRETVWNWLPTDAQKTLGSKENITITHMSTAALVGKIEDITEEYDLIYIGDDSTNPDKMYLDDGYLYANIGETVETNSKLVGLLDSDKTWNGWYRNTSARYSGNDLTPRKQRELVEFAKAGHPIVLADGLLTTTGGSSGSTLSVTVEPGSDYYGRTYLYATATLSGNPGADITYEWYDKETGHISQNISWDGRSYYGATPGHTYYCQATVTIGGKSYTATSESYKLTTGSFRVDTYGGWRDDWGNPLGNSAFSGNSNSNGNQVTVECIGNDYVTFEKATYTWYSYNYGGLNQYSVTPDSTSSSNTFTLPNDDRWYICKIEITYKKWYWDWYWYWDQTTIWSPRYKLVPTSGTFEKQSEREDQTIGAVAGDVSINTSKIDSSSLLYSALSEVFSRKNVMSQSSFSSTNPQKDENQNTLVQYLNLSRPEIVLSSKPEEYNGNIAAPNDCRTELKFTFTITNPTDATPTETQYECRLYIDQNGDGLHSENERISDLGISGGTNGELKADVTYTLTRDLDRSTQGGILPWKLQVVKVGDPTVHASQKGYSYLTPNQATPINVLQVRYWDEENLEMDPTFTNIYEDLRNAKAYDLTVKSITVNQLNNMSATDRNNQFNWCDMLIIGFGDMYQELNRESAEAIAAYIDTGKSILFTHDTTSFCNVEDDAEWGYYFNTIIRDKVGLDRYGVTSTDSAYASAVKSGVNGAVNSTTAQALRNDGYTVAYVPGSTTSALQTQGYTNLTLRRYRSSGGGNITTTEKVTQVNQGQITEFPFHIDMNLDVALTHEQYYQLNMNADDIVVWYCLGGNKYENYKNDAVNAYYIYSRGNVTYSGAGHFFSGGTATMPVSEAKLFVNTMIAAHRAGNSAPTIDYCTESGSTDVTMRLLPMEYTGEGGATNTLAGDTTIYFKIQDSNLSNSKSISVSFAYDDASGEQDPTLQQDGVIPTVKNIAAGTIRLAGTTTTVTNGELLSNTLYQTTIPDEVMNAFRSSGNSEMRIFIKATTRISGSSYIGFDELTLRKLGLLLLK